MQEVRRIANKLAVRQIQPAYIIAWSDRVPGRGVGSDGSAAGRTRAFHIAL
jgi:hypothetical protein